MKKLTEQDGISLNMVNENLEALKAIFPEAFTEDLSASDDGQAGGVDFEVLRQLLGDVVDEGEEKDESSPGTGSTGCPGKKE
jgi:adenine-specific DNA-methyltransferase